MKIINSYDKILVALVVICFTSVYYGQGLIIDHNCANLNIIPVEWIDSAKAKLHIAYQHTSHGSQLISGMTGLQNWKGDQYVFSNGGSSGALDLHDNAMASYGASDLGNPDRTSWAQATYNFLNNPDNNNINVIIWSWCGQASTNDSTLIQTYLDLMTSLENSFPNIKFVYMTGHLDGSGIDGSLNQRNEQIRRYCRSNNKILYDFADIESYDPDGNYYLDKMANDNCDYDSDGNGSRDKNWAADWQASHTENTDWYNCSAAHSQALNGNRKAYAAWWLWASLAGWNSLVAGAEHNNFKNKRSFVLNQNYPNPFNPSTKIKYTIPNESSIVQVRVYDICGKEICLLVNENQKPGEYEIVWDASNYPSGVYFYRINNGQYTETKKMLLLR